MFTIILGALLAIGGFLFFTGAQRRSKTRITFGVLWVILSLATFWFLDFWGEKLWFDALGYNDRFWILFTAKIGFTLGGAVIAALFVFILLFSLPADRRQLKRVAIAVGAVIGGFWGFGNWSVFLQFWNKVSTAVKDPILEQDVGFYLFSLPFFDQVQGVLVILSVVSLAAAFFGRFQLIPQGNNYKIDAQPDDYRNSRAVFLSGAILIFVLAAGKYLDRFHLLYSDLGAVSGPGWTDVNIKLPALTVVVIITVIIGILLLIPAGRLLFEKILARLNTTTGTSPGLTFIVALVLVLAVWFIALTAIPGVFQNYRVEPNEITYEKPFIANNIEYTRMAYQLAEIEEREFPAADTFTRDMVQQNKTIFNNIRLWDWRALDAVLKQFQEIRLYYEFRDVDIDRYTFNGEYRQVMVSAREMEVSNLPPKSQTFVNEVFKYTHGYGITLTTVSEFTPEGLPHLLVKNIPPVSEFPELEVKVPQIYYGEITDNYVVVNSSELEFDFPQGDENNYISYPGTGGVQISNFFRKLIYSYKMGGTKLLFSSYPTSESRIMFRRQIKERIKMLAPFLQLDDDPYIVNADGKLYWMIDAYTTSSYYPYSEPFSSDEIIQYKEGDATQTMRIRHNQAFQGMNYIRNSVKVVVDAFNGSVDFYRFDDNDPLIQVWDKIFPGLIKERSEMPENLLAHIRYPADYLLIQGLIYAKYHMEDPEVFYNQEDLWIRATENYYGQVMPVDPYYITWELPGSDDPQFTLILPFTPKNRQVSIGWIAGLCDPENYGRFISYNFPKEKRVLGPQQVETKIDQNSFLSGQLSLWDQRGSRVIRGNVLAIPVENTIIYVEPIYLQAETAAYPELRLVCIMHDDNLSYAPTFDEALEGIFGDAPPATLNENQATGGGTDGSKPITGTLVEQANQAFSNYMNATGAGDFERASEALEQLQSTLRQLQQEANTETAVPDTIN